MNINRSILLKKTKKLFFDQYQYKVVLIFKYAYFFRSKNYNQIEKKLIDIKDSHHELNFLKFLSSISDFTIRVERVFLSFYSNDASVVERLSNTRPENIKYVSAPDNPSKILPPKTIYLKNINYDYKITLKNHIENHNNFLGWAKDNPKIRMSSTCRKVLETDGYSNNNYFYAKDYKTLTVVQIFIGPYISRIDKIINNKNNKGL